MKYKIIDDGSNQRVVQFIAEDGESIIARTRPVLTDKYGHEYVKIPNPYHHFNLYTKRIKDAVKQVVYGIGDAITSNDVGRDNISVIMFLDRVYGSSIKQKYINEWQDAKFGYSIYGYYSNGIGSSCTFNKDGRIYFPGEGTPLVFDDLSDAYSKISEWESDAIYASIKYKKMKDDCEKEDFLKSMPDVVFHMLFNYLCFGERMNECGGKFILKVCQAIKTDAN